MKRFILSISLFLFTNNIIAQNVAAILKEAWHLENIPNEKAALEKYKQAFKLQPNNINALNKCSELSSRIGKREPNEKIRVTYFQNAKNYANAAIALQQNNSEAYCVMAIALGCIALDGSNKEKVNAAKEIKKQADLSLKYDPNNFKAWHVLGRWHYELSSLNGIERVAIKVMFGGLPKSNYGEAVKAFEKAAGIKNFAANYLEMAKAYKKNDQKDKAIATLKSLIAFPEQTEEDAALKAEGRKLLHQWQGA